MAEKCDAKVEVWSRVVGFFRPVQQWNRGKREEFAERVEFVVDKSEPPAPVKIGGAGGSEG